MTPQVVTSISGYEFHGDPEGMLRTFCTLGVDGVEVWERNLVPDVHTFSDLLAKSGLRATAVSTGATFRINAEALDRGRDVIDWAVDVADRLGAPFVTTYMGENPHLEGSDAIEAFVRGLVPCAERAAERGVRILVENMFDSRGEDPTGKKPMRTVEGTIATLAALSEWDVGLTYDPCNFYIAGEDPIESYDRLVPYIQNFHVKDAVVADDAVDVGGPTWSDSITGRFRSVIAGEGVAGLDELLARAVQDGFAGPFTIDIMTHDDGRDQAYAESVSFLKQQLRLG